MNELQPGCRVEICNRLTCYEDTGRVVEVRKNSVHVQIRRIGGGRMRLRWVKLSRVVPCS